MDHRQELLRRWLGEVLETTDFALTTASADASFRRYFRVTTGGRSFIAMDAPPDREDCTPFLKVARAFRGLGLNVPEIRAQDPGQGLLLLTDLGDIHYLQALDADNVDRLYGDAMAALLRLQRGGDPGAGWLPPYGRRLLLAEMGLFRDWLLDRHLGLVLAADETEILAEVFELLADVALAQPQVWVHRDFHSRNLMVVAQDNPGVLDFQDAVIGPITYDLVSLLKDCYIRWPRARIERWAREYYDKLAEVGLVRAVSAQEFLRWFDLMGVQRHLKASGIFARLNHRDGKPGYLAEIPRTLGYITEVSDRYPEIGRLGHLIRRLEAPLSHQAQSGRR